MRKILSLLTIIISINSFGQIRTCKDFKNGTFKYFQTNSGIGYGDLITTRNDSLQIDSFPKLGLETESQINWISDCKYEMEIVKVNLSSMKTLIGVKKIVEITSINNNEIIFRTDCNGIIEEREMIKIK